MTSRDLSKVRLNDDDTGQPSSDDIGHKVSVLEFCAFDGSDDSDDGYDMNFPISIPTPKISAAQVM